jgi:hypothetical protein
MTMTMGQGNGRDRHILMLATAAAFLAAVLFASAAPALADDHGHRGRGYDGHHGNGHAYGRGASTTYVVPQVLSPVYVHAFQPYYSGQVYYAPHHHYHAAYNLPVYYGGVVAYRPYSYCGDHLFVSGAFALPRLALSFNFGSPGGVAVGGYYSGGYYPVPPPPAPYSYEVRPYSGGCRHDHDDGDYGY